MMWKLNEMFLLGMTNSTSTPIPSSCTSIKKINSQSTHIKTTKMILSVIRLSFCFANDNRMTLPSGSHFEKNCKPDGGVILLSFAKQNDNQMTPPSGSHLQNDNRMTPPSNSHFEKKCKSDGGVIRLSSAK